VSDPQPGVSALDKWQWILTSYAIAAALFAAAAWLSWDWSWAVKVPLLVYLAIGMILFPVARMPGEALILTSMLWSPVHLTGLLAVIPRALVYAVTLLFWIIFVPIGAVMRFAGRKLGRADRTDAS